MNKQILKIILASGIGISAALAAASAQAITFTPTSGGPNRMPVNLVAGAGGAYYTLSGDRIWKTANDGASWSALATLPPVFPSTLVTAGSRLFTSTARGVYVSNDDGATWSTFNGSGDGALPTLKVQNLHSNGTAVFAWITDSNFNTILLRSPAAAAAWSVVTPQSVSSDSVDQVITAGPNTCLRVGNSGVKYSTDGGVTWLSSSGTSGTYAAMAAGGSSVYLVGTAGQVKRSTNNCQTFADVTSNNLKFQSGRTVTAIGVAVDGAVYAGLSDGTIMSSTDNGANFNNDNSGSLTAPVGAQINSLAPTANGMLAGTEGLGAHGKTTGNWAERNNGLRGASIVDLIAGSATGGFFAAHAGGILGTTDAGSSYSDLNSGLDKRPLRALVRAGAVLLAGTDGNGGVPGLFRSADTGASWTRLQTASGLPANASIGSLARTGAVFLATVVGADSATGLYRSIDEGLSWTQATAGLPVNLGFNQRNLAVEHNGNAYLYVSGSGVYRSVDNGANWTFNSTGLGGNKGGKVFAAGNILFASAGGIVYRSADHADTWQSTTGFAVSKFGIEIISAATDGAGGFYLGDEHAGLSISKDGGVTWIPDSDGLAQSPVCIKRLNGLLFKDGKLYAGQGEGGGIRVADPIGNANPGDSVACTTNIDNFPNSFSFTAKNNVPPGEYAVSNLVSISGLGASVQVPMSISGGEYSIGGCEGPWSSAATTIGNAFVCVRHMAPNVSETATSTTLNVAEESSTFTSKTGLVFDGRPDQINTGFGSGGFATVQNTNGAASDVLVQTDGKVVLAGGIFNTGFAIARRNADGTPDSSFGNGGLATVNVGSNFNLRAMLIQPDGKIVVGGHAADAQGKFGVVLVRLNGNDGSLDSSFGAAGIARLNINPNDETRIELVSDIVLLADGSILISGNVTTTNQGDRFFVVKFNSAGAQVTSFGDPSPTFGSQQNPVNHFVPGVAHAQVHFSPGAGASSSAGSMVVQSDGKIVVVGSSTPNTASTRCGISTARTCGVVVRFNANGTADTGYGPNGDGVINLLKTGSLGDVLVLPGDKLLVSGAVFSGAVNQGYIARLNSDGGFDTTFSGDGMHQLTGFDTSSISKILLLTGNKIAILGNGTPTGGSNAMLYAILNANGAYDSSFGPGGQGYVMRGALNGQNISGGSMARRADGGVVIGGSFQPAGTALMAAYVFGGEDGSTPPGPDTTPDAFSFNPHTGAQLSTVIVSNSATITGINQAANVTVSGGEYSVGCNGAFTSAAGTISSGQTVCVRHTTSAQLNTQTSTTLTVGGVSATYTSTTRQADTTPADFQFPTQGDVARNTVITSAAATISGIEVPVAISVSNGSYSVGCTGSFVTQAGTISSGQTVCARHTSANMFGTNTDTVITVGTVSRTFRSTTVASDTTPATFTFVDVRDVEPGSTQTSNSVTITGINAPAEVAVTGGSYSIDGGNFVTTPGTIANGQAIRVRHTAAATTSTPVNTELNIGGLSDIFTSTTRGDVAPIPDTTPEPFNFGNIDEVEPGAYAVTNAITVSGINQPAAISVVNGEYSINGGDFTAQAGSVSNGQTVRARRLAGPIGSSATVRVIIGGVEDSFRVKSSTSEPGTIAPNKLSGTVDDSQGDTVSLSIPAGSGELANLRRVVDPAAAPAGFRFPDGFFGFDINNVPSGGSVTVTITLPPGVRPTNYVKCIASSCFRLPASKAVITGGSIALTLTDGDPETDASPAGDGKIVDPGAPAIALKKSGGSLGLGLLFPLIGLAALRRRKQH